MGSPELKDPSNVIVGISEMGISDDPRETLITYSLGSCVGLTIYDPAIKTGGLIHCMLPTVTANKSDEEVNPLMYVDTGVLIFLERLFSLGVSRKRLICAVAGCGASSQTSEDIFKIGERNYTMLRKVLWKNGIIISGEVTGGSYPKTMTLEINTGIVHVKNGNVKTKIEIS